MTENPGPMAQSQRWAEVRVKIANYTRRVLEIAKGLAASIVASELWARFMRRSFMGKLWVIYVVLIVGSCLLLLNFVPIGEGLIGFVIIVGMYVVFPRWVYLRFFSSRNRGKHIVECRSCGATMTRQRWEIAGGCGQCGSDLAPRETARTAGWLDRMTH